MSPRIALLALLLAIPGAALAHQEPPAPEDAPEVVEEPAESPLVAAGWCAIKTRRGAAREPQEPVEGEEPAPAVEPVQQPSGCDIGVGVSLYQLGRAGFAGAVGTETLGLGFTWRIAGGSGRRVIAVALGYVVPYDSGGVYLEGGSLAIGATLSLARPGQ